jgi:hypothetical protein
MVNPLRILWPPWRFARNIKSASDSELESLSDGAVVSEWGFAALVVLGVVGEFIIAAYDPPHDSLAGRWGPAYGDLMIAFGVAGEVVASAISHVCQGVLTRRSNAKLEDAYTLAMIADGGASSASASAASAQYELSKAQTLLAEAIERAGEANARAAEASERAAQAELKLAEFRRPRLPTTSQLADFVEKLKPFAGTKVDIGHGPDGFREQLDFIWRLEPCFINAGWTFMEWDVEPRMQRWPAWGTPRRPHWYGIATVLNVTIELNPESREKLLPVAQALTDALNDIGITTTIEARPISSRSRNMDTIHFLVGEKT